MAEIATNVLHNVGNVLNSVNVSASLVTDAVRNSRGASLTKVASLLKSHEATIGEFVSRDERGRHLPAYLAQLAEQLQVDQAAMLKELASLRRNIDHIKEIVAMQQSYARRRGVPERQSVAGMVEDAMRIVDGSFARRAFSVHCDIDSVPDIVVEKHRVVEILINLLRNARHACEVSGRSDCEIRVRAEKLDQGIQISVSDTGIGISPDTMAQLFRHGFTTKSDGHGFGLHSGALAAREMGGALRAESAGSGLGATFTLELPLAQPESSHV
jgi:signal transduction histidine kinase